jgi:hypothetical protein
MGIIVLGVFLALATSCNKAVINELRPGGDYGTDTANIVVKQNKVLYIIVDGLRGEAIKTYMPINLNRIAKKSIYTFNSLNNSSGINAITWSDMMTGVDSSKHQVKTADFAGNNLAAYPSIVTRLKNIGAKYSTASFVRSASLDANLLQDATNRKVLSSDAAVEAAAVNSVKSDQNTLFLVELSAVDSTGRASGYDNTNADYHDAVLKADTYIGNLVAAVGQRASFDQENWLIVVASNGGGPISTTTGADQTYYNNSKANGFVYFYNPRFTLDFYAKPGVVNYQGATPVYSNSSFYAKVEDASAYDIGPNTEITISFKMKILELANNTYNPGILKKTNSSANSNDGWWFIHNNNTGSIRFVLNNTSSGTNYTLNNKEHPVGIDEWHAYTGKVYFNGSKRYMKLFVDGLPVVADPIDVTGYDCTTATAMDIGQRGSFVSGSTKEMITDIEIYDVALPDDVIAERACKPDVNPTDPYYENLIGYWPCTDGNGEVLKDLSPNANNMVFINEPSSIWNGFNDASNNICPDVSADYLIATPKGLDIPYEIYQWLGIQIQPSWKLDGKFWSTGFNNLKEN